MRITRKRSHSVRMVNMSTDDTRVLLEGFLQKRKDTLKLIWVTYWFRLQNTTLFFYTKRCSASHLRGYYYMYTVQSVTVLHEPDRFMFQINMKNGKRKTLAAETAELREQWVTQLWEAMYLSVSGLTETRRDTEPEECGQEAGRENSSSSQTESPVSPASTSIASLIHNLYESTNVSSSDVNPQRQNGEVLDKTHRSCGLSRTGSRTEGVYDVLPLRNQMCVIDKNKLLTEGVYDTPVRRMNQSQEMLREAVYDTPKIRQMILPQDSSEGIYNIPRAPTSAATPGGDYENVGWRI